MIISHLQGTRHLGDFLQVSAHSLLAITQQGVCVWIIFISPTEKQHLTELKYLGQGSYFCVWLRSAQLQIWYSHCVSNRSHWLLLEIIQFSEGERNWPSPRRNAALGLQKLAFKYCLKLRRCCHMSAKFDKPWVWENLGQLGDKEGFYGNTHDSPHRGFLWSFGSLGNPFFCEAISKCYLDSQKGQKYYNKQGVLNTLFGFLTCTNIVSEDNPGTGCLGLLFLGGIR